MSCPNVADWQYLGVDEFTLGLELNCGRKARKGHICEETFAYGSYSSKDIYHKCNNFVLNPHCVVYVLVGLPGFARLQYVSLPSGLRTSIKLCPWNTLGGAPSGSAGPFTELRVVRPLAALRLYLALKNARKQQI